MYSSFFSENISPVTIAHKNFCFLCRIFFMIQLLFIATPCDTLLHMVKPVNTINKLKKGEPVTIVALGDSLTYGWMVDTGYVDYFYDFLKIQYPGATITIFNKGVPGDTADGGLHRVGYDVIPYNPDCVLIQFALNDCVYGYTPDIFGNYIRAIISTIQQKIQCDIIIITSVWFGESPEAQNAYTFYDMLITIANKYNLPIAMTHQYWEDAVKKGTPLHELVQFDGVHPTEEGYYIMSLALQELFT